MYSDWRVNGAGLRVSHRYRFGAIDAEAMVTRAKRWINVPAQMSAVIASSASSGYESYIIAKTLFIVFIMHLSVAQALNFTMWIPLTQTT